jgi:endonuclease YncB( thermonuclease family)
LLSAALCIPTAATAWRCEAVVERVHDGDTLTVRCPERRFKLRLQGVDTPELGQPFGEAARDALAAFLAGKPLIVESRAIDAYDRVIGRAWIGERSLADWLLASGWAWCPSRSTAACRRLEAEARTAERGLWRDAAEPMPPWQWRREHPRDREPPR